MTLLRVQIVVLVKNFGFNYDKTNFWSSEAECIHVSCQNVQYVTNIIVFCVFFAMKLTIE